ncbi:MAG: ABC transporter substrate-binding protein [Candidatus Devosia phytovorans]|uniref:ABC transporter substrate-binding protein n=1 Tax=Candidatus Devosia phytovorans TaxID=3121372 RepID=A0AAJ5VTG3_9HYPH|nr:ABC transporter substrate-binding protein [Devosia sp.]WEK03615.1 MAG: ABC transporter substrate-binding protein [Devosia sp.]
MIKRLTILTTFALLGTASTAFAQEEVIMRMAPVHTDAHVENYNPYNLSGPQAYVQDFAYEPLWIYNVWHPEADFPALATSFDIAEDLKSVTYHLREGVVWSDGEPFDADDVVFTYDYAKAHRDYPVGFDFYEEASKSGIITSVEKLDAHTVRFNLQRPDSLAHLNIGSIFPLPEHIWKDVDDPRNYANPTVVGTGPFTEIRDFSRNSFKLCRNESYRENDTNLVDCVEYPQLSDNLQVIAAITNGELDWATDGIVDPDLTYANQSEHNKYWLPPDAGTNLQLNTTKAPFNNLEFRKAMSMAIDREGLVDIATFGLTTPAKYPIGEGMFYQSWFDEAALQPYEYLMAYDPDAAMAVLDAAGFIDADGDGWRDNPDGTPIAFDISVPAGWDDWVNTVQMITENLQDIGVNAEMETPEEGAWFENMPTGDFDVYILWTNLSSTPWYTYYSMFNPNAMTPGTLNEQSMHQMRIPAIEEDLAAISATADEAEQHKAITEIMVEVAENLPVITLYSNPAWYEYSTRNFTGWPDADNPWVRPNNPAGVHERVKVLLSLTPVTQ